MNSHDISQFHSRKNADLSKCLRVDFKKRNPLYGFVVAARDFEYLKSKNFWRIVMQPNLDEWNNTGSIDLAKIFNGDEITKLSIHETSKV